MPADIVSVFVSPYGLRLVACSKLFYDIEGNMPNSLKP